MNTYATINSSDSLYLFNGTPDDRYGVQTLAGNKRIWSADGAVRDTQHRNVKYYADVTGMSYADAFAACQDAHAAYQEQQRQWKIEREQRAQERMAQQYERREGIYSVEVPCIKVLGDGREVKASHYATVQASSAATAWVKAMDAITPDLIFPAEMDNCYIEFIGTSA